MELLDSYVAPWVLPNERFPLHFVWSPDDNIEGVRMTLPSGLEFESAFNADVVEVEPNRVRLEKQRPWDYLTVFLMFKRIPRALLTKKPVQIDFHTKDKVAKSLTLTARVVRPRLQLVSAPEEIEITDKVDLSSLLNFVLRQTGFGPIQIHIEATFEGQILTQRNLLARQIALNMITVGLLQEKPRPSTSTPALTPQVEVDESFRKDVVEEIDRILRGDMSELLEEALGASALKGIGELLRQNGPDAIMKFFMDSIETLAIDFLLNAIASHPGDQAELVGGPTRARIGGKIRSISLNLRYQDPVGNRYEELQVTTNVRDSRSKPVVMTVPVNLKIETALLGEL